MADLDLDGGLASEFVKFLNLQLKDTREQLQRSVEVSGGSERCCMAGKM